MRACFPVLLGLALALAPGAPAQRPPQAPAATSPPADPADQLSPQAAYADALHPLEVTRHNISNWSDIELAAMNVAIGKARAGCAARSPDQYTGAPLVDLARLCALGQQWPAVVVAAGRYIAASGAPRPLLAEAYIAQTEAYLRLQQEPNARGSILALLRAVPYTADVGDCADEVIAYMRFVHTSDALVVASARQPLVLAALRNTPAPIRSAAGSTTAAPAPPLPSTPPATSPAPHVLYAQGLSLASLQQLAALPAADAAATVAALDAAVPASLPPDEALLLTQQRQGYALLGKPLSGVKPLLTLSSPPNRLPQIPAPRTMTALLLFPDWCAACVRMGPQLPGPLFRIEGHSVYLYALLAETVPPLKPDPAVTNAAFRPAFAAAMLAETATVTVSPDTLNHFPAADYPVLLLTDTRGILRVLQPLTQGDVQPGGDLDAAIALVGRNFPAEPPSSAPGAAASASVP